MTFPVGLRSISILLRSESVVGKQKARVPTLTTFERSLLFATVTPRERLSLSENAVGTTGAQVLRVKALVAIAGDLDRPTAIHTTHRVVHPSAQPPDGDRRNRLIVIGRGLDEKAVDQVFRALRTSDVATSWGRPRPLRPLVLVAALFVLVILGALAFHLSGSRDGTATAPSHSSSSEVHR